MTAGMTRLFRLFVASYAPLAVILAVQRSEEICPARDHLTFWVLASVGIVGLVDAYRLPRGALRKGHIRVTISGLADEGGQVAAYIATYLLPFIGLDIAGWRDIVALMVYFVTLFIVFLQSDLALVNPALYLTGWRVVSGQYLEKRVLLLVPKDTSVGGAEIYVVRFGNFLVYHSEAKI